LRKEKASRAVSVTKREDKLEYVSSADKLIRHAHASARTLGKKSIIRLLCSLASF
jgi:hypothetical protein